MTKWWPHLLLLLMIGPIATRPAAALDPADEWTQHRLDVESYLQNRVVILKEGDPRGLPVLTVDLGGCSEIHQRFADLLPRMLPPSEVLEVRRRVGLWNRIGIRCLAETKGAWFVILDAQRPWCGNRFCNIEHQIRAFRFDRLHDTEAPEPLARLAVDVRSDGGDPLQILLTLENGKTTGMLVARKQWGPPWDAVDILRFVEGEQTDSPGGGFVAGFRYEWSGTILALRPLGSYPTIGYALLTTNDDPVPPLEIYEVRPAGEFVPLAGSRDFGASDDPVAREPTLLQAGLALMDWFDSITESSTPHCPGIDDPVRSSRGDLRQRMRIELAPYLVPSFDPIHEKFDDWWPFGVSSASAPVVCEPWETEKSNPRSAWRAAYGNNAYVAVSRSDRVYTSLDGLRWDEIGPPWPGPANDVAFGQGLFRLAGDGGRIWSSADGVNWDAEPISTSSDLLAITWTGDGWIAVGDSGTVVNSRTGEIWQKEQINNEITLSDVVADGGLVVAVGRLGPRGVAISAFSDLRWQVETLPRPLVRIHVNHGQFIAFDDEDQPWTSLDGIEWRPAEPRAPLFVSELENRNGIYVVGTDGRLGGINRFDNRLWFFSTSPASRDDARLFSELIASPTGGIAIVRGPTEDWVPIFSFEDDRYHAWQNCDFQPSSLTQVENAVEFDGGFVTINRRKGLGWSTDGRHWTWTVPGGTDRSWVPVAIRVAGPLVFAWGGRGRETNLEYSSDGRSWTEASLGVDGTVSIQDVTWTGDRWLLIAASGPVLESSDGFGWSQSPTIPVPPFFSQSISLLGGLPIIGTYFEGIFGLARPDSGRDWCPTWTHLDDYRLDWRLFDVPGGAVIATNIRSHVLVTTDGDTWHDLLPEIDRTQTEESFRFQRAIEHDGGIDLFANSRGRLMKTECRWRD